MKKHIFTCSLAITLSAAFSQSPVPSYTSGPANSVPGQPSQPAELYQGTNPAGGDHNKGTLAIPDPRGVNTPSNNTYYRPGTPASVPAPQNGSQANPGGAYPNVPVTPTPTNRLFQDPAKTSKYPNSDPAVGSVNGSTGKFAKHSRNGSKSFSKSRHHFKKTKKRDNGHSEKSRKDHTETR